MEKNVETEDATEGTDWHMAQWFIKRKEAQGGRRIYMELPLDEANIGKHDEMKGAIEGTD
jgi:hypothetical protein